MAILVNDSDRDWQSLGSTDPYYAVLSEPRFRRGELTSADRAAFFASGEAYLHLLLDRIRTAVMPEFTPRRALDFGCGVGRVTFPLARVAGEVVAVDVAPAMLAEAARVRDALGVANVTFALSDDELSQVVGSFDFVHSYIVFQHIPPRRGLRILERLLARLEEGGVAALHIVYAQRTPLGARLLGAARARVPFAHTLLNLALGRRADAPTMQMNDYSLSAVTGILHDAGCHRAALLASDHGGARGVMLLARKGREPSL